MSDEKNNNKRQVEEIYQLFSGLEKDSADGLFDEQLLERLIEVIRSLNTSDDPILKKLSKYADHLKPSMTLKHFATMTVPFERYLKKSIVDEDFIVTSQDRDHLVNPRIPLHFILDNMRSAFNVGSIFRTSDAIGVQKIWLTGYTPNPHHPQVDKAALGSSLIMDWEALKFEDAIQNIKNQNIKIIALETTSHAKDITFPFNENEPSAFLIGNERFGLDSDQIKVCDEVRKISMFGLKNSLNAGVAAAIAAYEWRKQWSEYQHKV